MSDKIVVRTSSTLLSSFIRVACTGRERQLLEHHGRDREVSVDLVNRVLKLPVHIGVPPTALNQQFSSIADILGDGQLALVHQYQLVKRAASQSHRKRLTGMLLAPPGCPLLIAHNGLIDTLHRPIIQLHDSDGEPFRIEPLEFFLRRIKRRVYASVRWKGSGGFDYDDRLPEPVERAREAAALKHLFEVTGMSKEAKRHFDWTDQSRQDLGFGWLNWGVWHEAFPYFPIRLAVSKLPGDSKFHSSLSVLYRAPSIFQDQLDSQVFLAPDGYPHGTIFGLPGGTWAIIHTACCEGETGPLILVPAAGDDRRGLFTIESTVQFFGRFKTKFEEYYESVW